MRTVKIIAILLISTYAISCARVPITGRKQTNLMPESELITMSVTEYGTVLSGSNVVNSSNADAQMIDRVGKRISTAVEKYLTDNNMENRIEGFQWEFKLIQEDVVNAWCMPGGKVAFYTGILPVCGGERGVAVVMGHEVAHAIARHGNERMSTGLVAQLGISALAIAMSENPTLTKDLFLQSVGIGTQLGMLSFSRKHESEADHMGLVFMAMAGFDPREAPVFWERMSAAGGGEPPEFLSTHPSHETRVSDLNGWLDEALKYYVPQ